MELLYCTERWIKPLYVVINANSDRALHVLYVHLYGVIWLAVSGLSATKHVCKIAHRFPIFCFLLSARNLSTSNNTDIYV